MYGAIGFLGTVAVVVLSVKGTARMGALAFLLSVMVMIGYAVVIDAGAL